MEIAYLETTFFSFYHDERPAPAIVAMRDWTRQFWEERRDDYSLVTSAAVLNELRKGGAHHKKPALDLALTLPLIPIDDEAVRIVQAYVEHQVMPRDPAGDALHLALASFHGCDYLVTRNCRHLANASKFGHIRRVNAMLGLKTPDLVTPPELLGDIRI
jgi:predicted nucleic acid-binding protein